MLETINEQLKHDFYNHPEIIPLLEESKKAVAQGTVSPFSAAQDLLKRYIEAKSKASF
jgi:LAO/AO transport system kinase